MVCAAAAEVAELDQPVPAHEKIVDFQIPEAEAARTVLRR